MSDGQSLEGRGQSEGRIRGRRVFGWGRGAGFRITDLGANSKGEWHANAVPGMAAIVIEPGICRARYNVPAS